MVSSKQGPGWVEVLTIQTEGVPQLVQLDADVFIVDSTSEVVGAHSLAPVTTCTTRKAVGQPQ